MVMIAPHIITMNSAPLDNFTSLIGRTCPEGAPFKFGSVEKLYCVLAIQIGNLQILPLEFFLVALLF